MIKLIKKYKKNMSFLITMSLIVSTMCTPVFALTPPENGEYNGLSWRYVTVTQGDVDDDDTSYEVKGEYLEFLKGTGKDLKTAGGETGYSTNKNDYRCYQTEGESPVSYKTRMENVEYVLLPDNLTTIGDHTFRRTKQSGIDFFGKIKSVNFPATLTSIGNYAFYQSPIYSNQFEDDEEDIDMSEGGEIDLTECTRLLSIGEGAFSGCGYISEVKLPGNLTDIGKNAFADDGKLTTINLLSVYNVGEGAFSNCTALDGTIEFTKLQTLGKGAFSGDREISKVVINKSCTINTIQANTFTDCDNLNKGEEGIGLVIGSNIKKIEDGAFNRGVHVLFQGTKAEWEAIANGRTDIEIFGPDSVVDIDEAGVSERSDTLDGGDTWTYYNDPEDENQYILSFEGDCPIDDADDDGVLDDDEDIHSYRYVGSSTTTSSIKTYAQKTVKITFDDKIPSIGDYAFYAYPPKYKFFYNVKELELPKGLISVGVKAFSKCKNLESFVVTGDKLTEIDANAFEDCSNLKTVELGNLVTTIGDEAFKNCASLESINLPAIKTLGSNVFSGCTSLSKVSIGKSLRTMPQNAFMGCSNLTDLALEGKVEFQEYALANCSNLTNLYIEKEITFKDYAFVNCDNLTHIYYNGTRLEWQKIDKGIGNDALYSSKCFVHCKDGVLNAKIPAYATIDENGQTTIFVGQKIDPYLIFSNVKNKNDIYFYKTSSSKAKIVDPDYVPETDENGNKKKDDYIRNRKMGSNTYMQGKRKGNTKLTAYDERGNEIASCIVKILKRPSLKAFKTDKGVNKIYPGDTISANMFIKNCPEYPEMFTWESSDIDVATVTYDGQIKAKEHGKTTISLVYGTWIVRKKKISVKKSKSGYQIVTD